MSNENIKDAVIRFASISTHKPPVFKEEKVGKIIKYGDDLQYPYPDYLVRLYQTSPKHAAIINSKTRYTLGGGWFIKSSQLNKVNQAKAQHIIYNANPNETLNEVTDKADKDWNIFGGLALECIWDKAGKNVVEQYQVDFGKVRKVVLGTEKEKIEKYVYLDDWKGVDSYEKAKSKPSFKEWDYFGTKKKGAELFYYKDHKPVKSGEIDAYPLPEYVAACGYIEADSEIQNFHINNIKNNFWGGQIVTMQNIYPTEDGQKQFVSKFKSQKTGTDNTGEVLFIFANSDQQKVEVTPLTPSELDKQFDILNKTVRDEIFTAHNVTTPLLFGIRIEGSLGNRAEMMDGYEIFYSTYIVPRQQKWESIQNYIYSFNGVGELFQLKAVKPLTFQLSENIITQYLDRETVGKLVAEQLGIDTSEKVIQFSDEKTDEILNKFEAMGETISEDDIVRTYAVELNEGEPLKTDHDFKIMHFKDVLDFEITDEDADVLSLIKQNKKIQKEEIGDALGLTPTEVSNVIEKLSNAGLLKGELGKSLSISKSGGELLKDADVILDIEVRYRYQTRKDVPKAKSGSRPFCEKMMALSKAGKVYTKAEIMSISNGQDENTNAWEYRGGWYTNPRTEERNPDCRHFWESVIIKKRRG